MFASQFDDNSAFSGGGFMPSQATQPADYGVSPAKNRDTQGLFPLAVKQMSEAYLSSDDKSNFVVDGVDVNNVTLAGMVFNKAERVTDVTFTIDDGTGRIECHRWVNEAVDTKEMEAIQPVTDFNEISLHFIECIYVHVYNIRVQKLQGAAPTQPQVISSLMGTSLTGYQAVTPNKISGQFSIDGVKGIDQMVLDYLQQPSSLGREKGVHRDELAQQLNIPLGKIMDSIKPLEEEGLIYLAIDECHYKSTGNG